MGAWKERERENDREDEVVLDRGMESKREGREDEVVFER